MIQSIEQAFQIIDTQASGIPYEAIDFLQNQEPSEEITSKLVYALKNAYNGKVYFSDRYGIMMPTPLWYAVVAEKHLSKELFDPLLDLFTVEEDWDLINEQAVLLVGLLAEKFPEEFVSRVLDFVEKNIQENKKTPYLFAFEALYYIPEEQMARAYDILKMDNFHWVDHFIRILGDLQRQDSLPHFKELLAKYEGKHAAVELNYYIEILEGKHPEFKAGEPFFKMRGEDWKSHYRKMEYIFAHTQSPLDVDVKVGRNDPCPCGSGKKYKNCCLN